MSKGNTPQAIRGTQDMLGEQAARFQHVIDTFDRVRRLYGFGRVEVPVFEATAVFARSLGETTDVVSKEMYSFEDRGGDSLTLRPEFTAGIARAYLTNGWQQHAPLKVATHGPLFRYERPQKGRFRQFHQLDAEVIGAAEPAADVEILCFADQLLRELGVADGVTLMLNTLGDQATRHAWHRANTEYFSTNLDVLSLESRIRLEKNVLRILDSKDPSDQELVAGAPPITKYLTHEAGRFFDQVVKGLDAAGVKWDFAPRLVRGLDYYSHTAFEFVTHRLGAQGTVLGGGRYDGLIEMLGGERTPAVGWAAGIERLAMLIEGMKQERLDFVLVADTDEMIPCSLTLAQSLRSNRRAVDIIYRGSPRKRGDKAAKLDPKAIIFVVPAGDKLVQLTVKSRVATKRERNKLYRNLLRSIKQVWTLQDQNTANLAPEEMLWDGAIFYAHLT